MPTTNSPKGSAIPVRPTPQMRQQLDELSAAGFGNTTDVIRTAIDRMHTREIKKMKRVRMATLATEIADIVLDADSKSERDVLSTEIYNWLVDGDLTGDETADELAAEWEEREELANAAAEMRAPTYNGGCW